MPGRTVHQNGHGAETLLKFDPDDPEYIKELQRPAVIKEDLCEMERRKRVAEILANPFRGELEKLVQSEKAVGSSDARDLDRLAEAITPRGQLAAAQLHGVAPTSIIPISDLRGNNTYSKQDKMARNRLASLFRLVDIFQWAHGFNNHASVAVMKCGLLPLCDEALTIGPISYHDCVSTLSDPEEIDSIVSHLGTENKVLLVRNGNGALVVGSGPADAFSRLHSLVAACEMQVILLRGHGSYIVAGSRPEEVVHLTRCLLLAADHQLRAARAGLENLVVPDEATLRRRRQHLQRAAATVTTGSPSKVPGDRQQVIEWRPGELEWEAWMRVMDNAGLRTGHIYKQPFLRALQQAASTAAAQPHHHDAVTSSDVVSPPAAAGSGDIDYSDPDQVAASRLLMLRREQERVRWLNSPNAYQKVEFLETGTQNPKKITKWIRKSHTMDEVNWVSGEEASSPSHSTPVKITSVHQFAPVPAATDARINPKEFREKQRAIKEARRIGVTSAGPRSHVLEGVTYEDMARLKESELTGSLDRNRVVMIGTASKGIIDRDYRHNAQVYKQLYTPNPFAHETDEDIEKYMQQVRAKSAEPPHDPSPPQPQLQQQEHRPLSPVDSATADTVSLMQARRNHNAFADGTGAGTGPAPGSAATTDVSQATTRPPATTTMATSAGALGSPQHHLPVAGVPFKQQQQQQQPPQQHTIAYTTETTFEASRGALPVTRQVQKQEQQPPQPSSVGGFFRRSKSERHGKVKSAYVPGTAATMGAGGQAPPAVERSAASDDEDGHKKEKKKKRGFFSFGKKKKDKAEA